ncbi:NUDIX domain-containing protein [Candidatus Saccharibacteria bacterium]|nr:NUDIX domain-containing protein [Candidatus Saccharibacteria bacterium]
MSRPIKARRQIGRRLAKRFKITAIREYSAGGFVFRQSPEGEIEFLLIEDKRGRWSIAKGHIDPGETSQETALREINEETNLESLRLIELMDEIYFFYKIEGRFVHMTVFVYLVEAIKGFQEKIQVEDLEWITGVKWFSAVEAYKLIEYPDLKRLTKHAYQRITGKELIIP